jgi:hypothetical protein
MKTTITEHFLVAMIWADLDEENPTNDLTISDVAPECRKYVESIVDEFIKQFGDVIPNYDESQIGHDLYLTITGHGTGFWDNDGRYSDRDSKRFDEFCKQYPSKDPYVGDDNLIYMM